MSCNYEALSNDIRPHVFIGAISGILKRMDDRKGSISAEDVIKEIRAELDAFNRAEVEKRGITL